MANKINFITGETYTLAELFSGERRIIIPDLQRDYCWGDSNNVKSTGETGELVSDFIRNLIDQYNEQNEIDDQGTLNLGLFYGYEVPANHIQLCDGQQRLTTLYLLLGMLNKKTGKIRQHLISDYQFKQDDKEPYLIYAIRESSLYFLRDLVCNFFIGSKDTVDLIQSTDWYFKDYDYDPTIQSILTTLKIIENLLNEISEELLVKFEDWLLSKITFLYFDMETRKNGEETFVVINTTGEALSATQNLKPLILQEENNRNFTSSDGLTINECWEEIDNWFWEKRNKSINDTSDAGFAEFLRWVSIIELVDEPVSEEKKTNDITKQIQLILQGKECDFPYRRISFRTIYGYWKALIWIADELQFCGNYLSPNVNKDVNNRKAISQNECFVLLPVLKYVFKNFADIANNDSKKLNVKRIYHFFKNLMNISNVTKNVNSLVGDAIKIIDIIENGDIATLGNQPVDSISKQILSEEEIKKFHILLNSKEREEIEKLFWETQDNEIWSGEILPIIKWSEDNNGGFNIETFREYKEKFEEVFNGINDNEQERMDCLRRALLTLNLNNYPFNKGINISFGYSAEDWHYIIFNNQTRFKDFFDSFELNNSNERINQIIDGYTDNTNNPWFKLIVKPDHLKYCEKKNVQRDVNDLLLIKQTRATTFETIQNFFNNNIV